MKAVILHKLKNEKMEAVAHASRILPAEKNYSQIEKEALILAVKQIHKMWHCRFVMQTDHKALLAIFGSKK